MEASVIRNHYDLLELYVTNLHRPTLLQSLSITFSYQPGEACVINLAMVLGLAPNLQQLSLSHTSDLFAVNPDLRKNLCALRCLRDLSLDMATPKIIEILAPLGATVHKLSLRGLLPPPPPTWPLPGDLPICPHGSHELCSSLAVGDASLTQGWPAVRELSLISGIVIMGDLVKAFPNASTVLLSPFMLQNLSLGDIYMRFWDHLQYVRGSFESLLCWDFHRPVHRLDMDARDLFLRNTKFMIPSVLAQSSPVVLALCVEQLFPVVSFSSRTAFWEAAFQPGSLKRLRVLQLCIVSTTTEAGQWLEMVCALLANVKTLQVLALYFGLKKPTAGQSVPPGATPLGDFIERGPGFHLPEAFKVERLASGIRSLQLVSLSYGDVQIDDKELWSFHVKGETKYWCGLQDGLHAAKTEEEGQNLASALYSSGDDPVMFTFL